MCMYGGDYDPPTFYRRTTPTARAEHRCGECRRTIQPGETYLRTEGLWDGSFYTFKMCAHCRVATGWLQHACEGWVWEMVMEDLAEHVTGDEAYLRSQPLTRLLRWMRTGWADRGGALRPLEPVQDLVRRATAAFDEHMSRITEGDTAPRLA